MMKKVVMKNADKMVMESGHRTFDKQTNLIGKGSMSSNTQCSHDIRSKNQTECSGMSFPVGHLQSEDLDRFVRLPNHIRKEIEELTENQSVLLYEFFHTNNKERIIHGYVVTTPDHAYITRYMTGPTRKSYDVINECILYIAKERASSKSVPS